MIKIDLVNGEGVLEIKGNTEQLLKEYAHITEHVTVCVRKSAMTDEAAKNIMKDIFKKARGEGIRLANEKE